MKEHQTNSVEQNYRYIIEDQFHSEIVKPLQLFTEKAKHDDPMKKIDLDCSIETSLYSYFCILTMPSGDRIEIEIRPVWRMDSPRPYEYSGERVTFISSEVTQITYEGRRILAWGSVLSHSDERGFNLLLIEKENHTYGDWYYWVKMFPQFASEKMLKSPKPFPGDWYMLLNSYSPFVPEEHHKRPNPFPFNFDELPKRIDQLSDIGQYFSDCVPLNLGGFEEFLHSYL